MGVERDFLGLSCDAEDDAEERDIKFLEYGFTSEPELRRRALKDGWTYVPNPGAPWHGQYFCPRHKPPLPRVVPEGIIEIKG